GWEPADRTAPPLSRALGWLDGVSSNYPQATVTTHARDVAGAALFIVVLDVPETAELICQLYDFAAESYPLYEPLRAWLGADPVDGIRDAGIAGDYWEDAPGLPGVGIRTTFV